MMKLKPQWKDFISLIYKLSFYSLHTSLTILVEIPAGVLAGNLFGNWDYLNHKTLKSCESCEA